MKLDDPMDSGYLFTITNPTNTISQLGVKIEPLGPRHSISLLYSDITRDVTTNKLATFTAADFVDKWVSFSLKVQGNNITFYLECQESGILVLQREPKQLTFDPASTLHLFNGGSVLKGDISVSRTVTLFIT